MSGDGGSGRDTGVYPNKVFNLLRINNDKDGPLGVYDDRAKGVGDSRISNTKYTTPFDVHYQFIVNRGAPGSPREARRKAVVSCHPKIFQVMFIRDVDFLRDG